MQEKQKEEVGKVNTDLGIEVPGIPPKILGVQMLQAGFIFTRQVVLIDAEYIYSFKTELTSFNITLLDNETHDRITQKFDLYGQEAKEMIDFIESYGGRNAITMNFTVKFGVPMDGKSQREKSKG